MMGGGFRMSFSSKNVGIGTAIFIVIFSTVALLWPVYFASWYAFWGGEDYLARRTLQGIAEANAVEDGTTAIEANDLKLYLTGGGYMDQKAPGIGNRNDRYTSRFGYKHLSLLKGDALTEEDKELNRKAMEYMTVYNKHVYNYVSTAYSGWNEDKRKVR